MPQRATVIQQTIRVSFVSLHSQYVHSSLAVWYLKSALDKYAKAAHHTTIIEGSVNENEDLLLQRIIQSRPQVLGLSCYIWNIRSFAALLPRLRAALPGCSIVMGGPEVSYNAEEILQKHPEVDYVLAGEGEKPIAHVLDMIASLRAKENIPGLCYRGQNSIQISPPFIHDDIAVSPFSQEYFHALKGRIAYIETSRGCPYHCAFCLSGRGDKLREIPLERALDEIRKLAQSGAKTIKFVDRTFNANRQRSKMILRFLCEEIAASIPEATCFHFEIAGDLLDDETLAIVEAAPIGLFQFEIGLQSMHETTLEKVRRQTNMNKLCENVRRLIRCGKAHVHLDLIAGLPHEGLDDVTRSFTAAFALQAQHVQLGFLKLIHGAAMRLDTTRYPCRFDPEAPYEVQETPWLSPADLQTLHLLAHSLDKVHNSGRFAATLAYLTRDLGMDAFALFLKLGKSIAAAENKAKHGLSLEELTSLVYADLCELLPGQSLLLRDLLLTDRLASTATTFLPACLRVKNEAFIEVKRSLARRYPRKAGITRAVAFLYASGQKQVIFCDYEHRNPVTGLYPIHVLPLSELGF